MRVNNIILTKRLGKLVLRSRSLAQRARSLSPRPALLSEARPEGGSLFWLRRVRLGFARNPAPSPADAPQNYFPCLSKSCINV